MFKLNKKKINFLVGGKKIYKEINIPFNQNLINFLNYFSNSLIKDKECRSYPDLIALSFWCSKKNIELLKNKINDTEIRIGKGLLFHITPSNVPTNFIYSLLFGLLSGNSNIVKVPSNKFMQIDIICKHLNKILLLKKFKNLKKMISIVRYKSEEKNITDYFSKICDLRIIWGGDKTINDVRQSPINPHTTDITFSDRYSFSIIKSKNILNLNKKLLDKLVKNFFNDTYLMDQNACSSPHIIFWYGDNVDMERSSKKFWNSLKEFTLRNYNAPDIAVVDKYNQLCKDIFNNKNLKKIKFQNNFLHVLELKKIDKSLDTLRGKWGYFYEYQLSNLNVLKSIINNKYQTLTYFGFKKNELRSFLLHNKVTGVERIVPIGQSLNMSLYWDGYDIVKSFSRTIEII